MDSLDTDLESGEFVLEDWLEFYDVMLESHVSVQRIEIEDVIEHQDGTTELSMKSGRSFYVNTPYDEVMEML